MGAGRSGGKRRVLGPSNEKWKRESSGWGRKSQARRKVGERKKEPNTKSRLLNLI